MSVNATTMRTRLDAHGITVPEGQPKALVTAYGALVKDLGGKYRAPEPKSTPATDRAKASTGKVATAPANCGCGCGHPTITVKATFLPGHDARYAGRVGRGEQEPNPAVHTPALEAKIAKIRATAESKQAVKDAKAAAKAAYDAALAAALA